MLILGGACAALVEAAELVIWSNDRRRARRDTFAAELERSAGRAQARGGLAAAAAFLERAALLTADPYRRAQRLLAAAQAKQRAGALDAAQGLLVAVEAEPTDELRAAEVERLRGQIALAQARGSDAARLLLSAARRFEPLDARLARETHLECLVIAMWTGELGLPGGAREAAEAARAAPPGPGPPGPVDVLLDSIVGAFTQDYAAAAPSLTRALEVLLDPDYLAGDVRRRLWLSLTTGAAIAMRLCDIESLHTLAARHAQVARDVGDVMHLRYAIAHLVLAHGLDGDMSAAALVMEEDRLIAETTGTPPNTHTEGILAGWRGHESQAFALIEASVQAGTAHGIAALINGANYASSVLYNGLGRHDAACDAA